MHASPLQAALLASFICPACPTQPQAAYPLVRPVPPHYYLLSTLLTPRSLLALTTRVLRGLRDNKRSYFVQCYAY